MPPHIVPPDVIQLLSFHGAAEVHVGGVNGEARGRVFCAPFEDVVYLFLPREGHLVEAMLKSCAVDLQARHKDGDYSLRLVGRGHPGVPLARMRDRSALEPWVPEGRSPHSYTIAPFVPERIELVRAEAEDRMRYHGPTRASVPSQFARWVRACFGGIAVPFAALSFAVPFGWLVVQGADYPWRPLALSVSAATGLAMLASSRLLVQALGYDRWRDGRAQAADAAMLVSALISRSATYRVGLLLMGISLIGLASVASAWGETLFKITLFSNAALLLGPATFVHLSLRGADGRAAPNK